MFNKPVDPANKMLPLVSTVNLVVPPAEAVSISPTPVLLTIKVALLPASPEISKSPFGAVWVPAPTLPVILDKKSD